MIYHLFISQVTVRSDNKLTEREVRKMRFVLNRLFGENPFKLLSSHTQKVLETVEKMIELIEHYLEGEKIQSEEIGVLEHQADLIKQEIRKRIPRFGLFLSVPRDTFLDFLWQQDKIADNAQDVAQLLELLPLKLPERIKKKLGQISQKCLETVRVYEKMSEKLEEVLATSFARKRVEEIWFYIDKINELEDLGDVLTREATKMIYQAEFLDPFEKWHLISLVEKLDNILDHMENAGGRLRIMTI